jgi:poly(A) polymerase
MFELRKLLMGDAPASVLKAMHASGELSAVFPELAALDIKDKDSHRHKNNFFHSLVVLEQAMDFEEKPDIVLRTAALLHDIGKPATRVIEASGEATFQRHEMVGARMAKKILKAHGGYSSEEIAEIYELIANHMRSYGFSEDLWTDSAVRRFASDISTEQQLLRLFSIFKADLSTKHASKRAKIYTKIDKLAGRVAVVREKDKLRARRPALNGHDVMELFGLTAGPELGKMMKFLNTEEGLALSRDEAIAELKKRS